MTLQPSTADQHSSQKRCRLGSGDCRTRPRCHDRARTDARANVDALFTFDWCNETDHRCVDLRLPHARRPPQVAQCALQTLIVLMATMPAVIVTLVIVIAHERAIA